MPKFSETKIIKTPSDDFDGHPAFGLLSVRHIGRVLPGAVLGQNARVDQALLDDLGQRANVALSSKAKPRPERADEDDADGDDRVVECLLANGVEGRKAEDDGDEEGPAGCDDGVDPGEPTEGEGTSSSDEILVIDESEEDGELKSHRQRKSQLMVRTAFEIVVLTA